MFLKKSINGTLLALIVVTQLAAPALAQAFYWNPYNRFNPYNSGYYNAYPPTFLNRHPILSGTLVGGAVGAAGGAAIGAFAPSEKGQMGRDAAVGGGAGALLGAGVGLVRNYQIHRFYGW